MPWTGSKHVHPVKWLALLGGLVALVLSGCASGPPEDVTLKGSITAATDVNPDASGRPSPLAIKIFQLKARDKFEQADFFALFDHSEATLGGDLLAVQSTMLAPGDAKPYRADFDPATRFVGVVAGYRDINQADWRAVVAMPEEKLTNFMQREALIIHAQRLSLTVSAGE